jgi:tRNA threonylcarbamoyladenosine biosynthesis protein TsaB
MPMNILAFDTALAACTAAVRRDGAVVARAQHMMERGQAEHLVPLIDQVMTGAGLTFAQIDRIAVTVGPGSFTGVRVALATARGLALARRIPVIGLTTGEVLAAMATTDAQTIETHALQGIVSLVDSKRGDVYVEVFTTAGTPRGTAVAMSAAHLADWLKQQGLSAPMAVVGDGVAQLAAHEKSRHRVLAHITFPDAGVMAALAAARPVPAAHPVPLYVRPPDVTLPGSAT